MSIKKLVIPVLILLVFSACTLYDVNKRKYNDLSREHNQIANEALLKKNEAVDDYNASKYEDAKKAAAEAKELFSRAQEISQQNEKYAVKIKDVYWLAGYQKKVIESEIYWIDIMDKVTQASDAQLSGNMSKANSLVKELEAKVPQYEALQKEIDKIEEEHKDFFGK